MATKKFNIPALFQQVFGIAGVRFAIPALVGNAAVTAAEAAEFAAGQLLNKVNVQAPRADLYQGVQAIPAPTAASVQSVLGTPIYEQVTLNVPITDSTGKQTGSYDYQLPDWPLFDIAPSWLIKKENTQGGSGTVKEFIQQDDFNITIRGFLINYKSQDYPEQMLADFWKAINCGKTMGIASRVFNLLGIHNIIVTNVNLPGVEGYMNMQPFEINALSDMPVLLTIKSTATQRAITPGL